MIAIPDTCNDNLVPVDPPRVRGDHAKAAWLKAEAALDRANGRIVAGRDCWRDTVNTFRNGK